MAIKGYKERSREDWSNPRQDQSLSLEEVTLGAILRIADAAELMAQNHLRIQSDLAWYKKRYEEEIASGKRMAKRIAAYQGIIKRIKKSK